MNPNEIVLKVAAALRRAGIPFMIVGSFSSNIYGIERSTQDADILIELEPRSIADLLPHLGADFHLDQQMGFETVTMTSRHILSHVSPFFKIELFLLSDDAHDRMRFSRRISRQAGGEELTFPTAEDVVVTKLRWSKGGRRTKDIDDVRNVLAVQQGHLDLVYIRDWARQHGTLELFERLLAETPII